MPIQRNGRFALIGKSGAGKSTAAAIFFDVYGARRASTGLICRQIAQSLFGNEAKSSTQMIDDALTTIDPSIFLKAVLRNIGDDERVCLDSLRFTGDLQIARERGFFIVRITAPGELRAERLRARGQAFDPEVDALHRSETELDNVDVDFTIFNDGSTQAMRQAIEQIFAGGL